MMRTDKKNLFIFTDGFPYCPGEAPFIIPEVRFLAKHFNITIVANVPPNHSNVPTYDPSLPDDVNIIPINKKGTLHKLLFLPSYFFSKVCKEELRDIRESKTNRLPRIIDSFKRYANAKDIQSFCTKKGLFSEISGSVYYSFWLVDYALALALEKERQPEMKVMSRVHGYDLYHYRNQHNRQPFQRFILEKCNAVIFVAEFSRKYIENRYPDIRTEDKYHVIRIATDDNHDEIEFENDNPDDTFILLSCSNVIPLKRVDLIAKALALLPHLNIQWIHIGGGDQLQSVEDYSQSHDLNARFLGHLAHQEVKEFYEETRVDAFITTSSTEGCPVSITEALSFGIPIIGTEVGGIPEQIEGNGVLLDANPSTQNIANAIEYVCSLGVEEKKKMRRRSRALWHDRFSKDVNHHLLLRAISEL